MTQDRKIDIVPVEGYDPKNYPYKHGIDITLNDVISQKIVEQISNLILSGYTDSTIKNKLYEAYKVNSYQAQTIINKAHKYLSDYTEEQEKNLLHKQNSRLFGLYRAAMNKGDNKTALQVLQEISKLNKLYTQRIEISSNVYTLDLGFETKEIKNDNTEQDN